MNTALIFSLVVIALTISILNMVDCYKIACRLDKLAGKMTEIECISITNSDAIMKCHAEIEKRVANPTQIERTVSDLRSEVKRLDNVVSNINHGFTSNPF